MKMEVDNRREQLRRATDRIQREIEEVTVREHELREIGNLKTTSNEAVNSKVYYIPQTLISGKLRRASSVPHTLESSLASLPSVPYQTSKMTNGVLSTRTTSTPLRFATSPSQKGLMHRFLATRGKIYNTSRLENSENASQPIAPTIILNPLSVKAFGRSLSAQLQVDDEPKRPPTRKGYVPIEEKIQKELKEMKERENELRLMRSSVHAKSQPNLLDIGNDNDNDLDIYDGSNSLQSGTSSNTLNDDEFDKDHSAKHKLTPRRRNTLIEKWENFINMKKKSLENDENENHF